MTSYVLPVAVWLPSHLTRYCLREEHEPAADATDAPTPELTMDSAIEHGKRAFALKKFEQAVDYYATALELM
jgi:hypothetical protein